MHQEQCTIGIKYKILFTNQQKIPVSLLWVSLVAALQLLLSPQPEHQF